MNTLTYNDQSQLIVTIDDNSLVNKISEAVKLIKGVSSVYISSSKSTVSLYEQLAYTCCNYISNPKISIHKQPQLLTAKVYNFSIKIVI